MGVEITGQIVLASLSVTAGAILALIYDIFGIIRRLFPEWLAIIWDGIYLFLAALGLFALAQGAGTGEFRLYIIGAALGGALLYRVLLGQRVRRLTDAAERAVCRIKQRIDTTGKNIGNFFKKSLKNCKKYLCKFGKLVYNNSDDTAENSDRSQPCEKEQKSS